jgi:hypothetical protein
MLPDVYPRPDGDGVTGIATTGEAARGAGVQDFTERIAFRPWPVPYSEEDVERPSLGQARQIRTADRSSMTASGTVDDTQRGGLIE